MPEFMQAVGLIIFVLVTGYILIRILKKIDPIEVEKDER